MKTLNRLLTCSLATSFIFTQSDENTADYLFKTINGNRVQSSATGKFLRSTKKFIHICREYQEIGLYVAPRSSSTGVVIENGATNASINFNNQSGQSAEASTEEERIHRLSLLNSYKDRIRPPDSEFLQPYYFDLLYVYPQII